MFAPGFRSFALSGRQVIDHLAGLAGADKTALAAATLCEMLMACILATSLILLGRKWRRIAVPAASRDVASSILVVGVGLAIATGFTMLAQMPAIVAAL